MAAVEPFSLAGDFPSADRDAWLAAVDRASGGRSPDELSTTVGDLTVRPLYTRADRDGAGDPAGFPGLAPFVRGGAPGGSRGWDVRQLHSLADPDIAAAAVDDLERGATSLLIEVGETDVSRLDDALVGVHLELAPVVLRPGRRFAEAADAMVEVWDRRGVAPEARLGGLGLDPVAGWAGHPGDLADAVADAASVAARHAATHPGVTVMAVDVSGHDDAVAELGDALAIGVTYLRALTTAGLTPAEAFDRLEFSFSATTDQWVTMAKLRAARLLWARVAEAAGLTDAGPQRQHAITAASMMTDDEPWSNLLRTTVAAFSAGIAGVDAVTCRPIDTGALGDGLSRRLARNTQLLLLEESGLGHVIDPAGGAWYLEDLTEQLARRAWSAFQAIEAAGGSVARS